MIKCTLCGVTAKRKVVYCHCEHCLFGNETQLMYHEGRDHCIAVKIGNLECNWCDGDDLFVWIYDFAEEL